MAELREPVADLQRKIVFLKDGAAARQNRHRNTKSYSMHMPHLSKVCMLSRARDVLNEHVCCNRAGLCRAGDFRVGQVGPNRMRSDPLSDEHGAPCVHSFVVM